MVGKMALSAPALPGTSVERLPSPLLWNKTMGSLELEEATEIIGHEQIEQADSPS